MEFNQSSVIHPATVDDGNTNNSATMTHCTWSHDGRAPSGLISSTQLAEPPSMTSRLNFSNMITPVTGSVGGVSTSTGLNSQIQNSPGVSYNVSNRTITLTEAEFHKLISSSSDISRPSSIHMVEKPKFRENINHPCQFIKSFDVFCSAHKIGERDKLTIVKSCFEGPALDWVTHREVLWLNFDDFKKDFLFFFGLSINK